MRKCLDLEVVWLRAPTAWQKHRAREKHHGMKHSVIKKCFALTLVPDINVIWNCYKKYQTGWWIRHGFSLATSNLYLELIFQLIFQLIFPTSGNFELIFEWWTFPQCLHLKLPLEPCVVMSLNMKLLHSKWKINSSMIGILIKLVKSHSK